MQSKRRKEPAHETKNSSLCCCARSPTRHGGSPLSDGAFISLAPQSRELYQRRKRYKISRKIRPYTLRSNFCFARKSPFLLGAGALAAHRWDRLMLLGSPPDMVHGDRLRKTHSSTQHRALRTASLPSSKRGSTPAIADFRCRAPLLPRLVWPYFTAYLYSITDFNINCKS